MLLNNHKRLIISFVEPEILQEKLQEIGVDNERDHLLVRRAHVSEVKKFYKTVSSYGNAKNYLSILSLGLITSLLRLKPKEIVFIFHKSQTELRIIANIIRFMRLFNIRPEIGIVDLDNEFWLEGSYHYSLVQGNPKLDLLISIILLLPVLIASVFYWPLALVYFGALCAISVLQIIRMSYFRPAIKSELPRMYCKSKLSFRKDNHALKESKNNILWLDLKNLDYCDFYSFPGCQLATDEYKRVFGYHVAENGLRCVAPVDDKRPAEIAILGASFSYGMYIDEGKTLADLLQAKIPQHRLLNLSFAKGCHAVAQYQQLDSIFNEYPNLNTVVIFLTDFWQILQIPDYTTLFKNLQAHDLPLYYRKKGKLHIASDFILKPCIMHELFFGKVVCKVLLKFYRKFIFPDKDCINIDEYILLKIREKCITEGKELLVAVGNRAHYLEGFLQRKGFNWVDATKLPDNTHIEDDTGKWHMALDHSRHPDEKSHAVMADNIYGGLKELVNCRALKNDVVSDQEYNKPVHEELDVYPLF